MGETHKWFIKVTTLIFKLLTKKYDMSYQHIFSRGTQKI